MLLITGLTDRPKFHEVVLLAPVFLSVAVGRRWGDGAAAGPLHGGPLLT